MPCAISLRYWKVAAPFTFGLTRVKPGFPLSDEPFPIRDIQFNDPEVVVLASPAIAIIPKFLRIFSILFT